MLITFDSRGKTSLGSCRRVTRYTFSRFSKIILVAIQDSADRYGSVALSALKRLGAREPIILEQFICPGRLRGLNVTFGVSQVQNERYKGPRVFYEW